MQGSSKVGGYSATVGYWESGTVGLLDGGLARLTGLCSPGPQALTNEDADGRVVVDRPGGSLRFVLLNAAAHFEQVGGAGRRVGPGALGTG